ncbi:MAG: acetyl-CoA carboxylase biotin carboxyl carrier protein subunit [Candidatus Pelagibacter sp.]|nr:acetyl-CoA carboxylase biotin carboxyl carrier protein subunit [Candidatus Pelagibacter sp.]OUV87371.1 MAG: acetyl-CoA carboxylase biotin carboxyl carrier protein subunit [Pelagibacteraceae bacterium TMED136]|tara:strand:- start:9588 stop:10004 length:417 start_codon:yes stop_codon:yes gene_type:complete
MEIKKEKIKELVKILDELNLTELSYSDGKTSIKVGKSSKISPSVIQKNITSQSSPVKQSVKFVGVKSPMVGTAYLAAEPGAKPFVTNGSKVKKGDTVLIIEAMKTMNHIVSTQDGEVEEILVKDGESVEFDQELIKIK